MVSALATFWMVGNITVAALAWIIIPTQKVGKVIVISGSLLENAMGAK